MEDFILTDKVDEGVCKNLINIFDEYDVMNVIFTGANADFGGAHINNLLSNIANKSEKYYFYSNLGESLFIDFLKNVDLIIGNSSSAFLEAPALKVPAINIGSRQDGRVTPLNVFSTKPSVSSLKIAIKKALNFKNSKHYANFQNPYGHGDASKKIIKFLEKI